MCKCKSDSANKIVKYYSRISKQSIGIPWYTMIIQKLELGLLEPSNRVINGLNSLTSGETYDTNIFQQLHLHASMNLKRKVQLMVHSK